MRLGCSTLIAAGEQSDSVAAESLRSLSRRNDSKIAILGASNDRVPCHPAGGGAEERRMDAVRMIRCSWAVVIVMTVAGWLSAAADALPEEVKRITVEMGDYTFSPSVVEVVAGRPVALHLTNTDRLTPHNFTLESQEGRLYIHSTVKAGKEAVLSFTPEVAGRYPFFCNQKLPFVKSHREHGMVGTLVVREAP